MNQVQRNNFIIKIKELFGKYSQTQVDGINYLLDFLSPENIITPLDKRQIAYILATVIHETEFTMQPIEEHGKGKGRTYGVPSKNGKAYYGRGYVQLTWAYNYIKVGKELGLNLYDEPDLTLAGEVAVVILIRGMVEGWFTGKKLSDYFNEKTDYINARKIVNGLDKADIIAGYAKVLYSAFLML